MDASFTPIPAPIPTRQATAVIDGVETQVVAQDFEDRVLVLVTQVGKVGQLTQASLPEALALPPMPTTAPAPPLPALPPPHPSTTLLALFGTPPSPEAQPTTELYTSQIAAIVWADGAAAVGAGAPRKPVVVGLALKRRAAQPDGEEDEEDWVAERRRFGQVMSLVMQCRVW